MEGRRTFRLAINVAYIKPVLPLPAYVKPAAPLTHWRSVKPFRVSSIVKKLLLSSPPSRKNPISTTWSSRIWLGKHDMLLHFSFLYISIICLRYRCVKIVGAIMILTSIDFWFFGWNFWSKIYLNVQAFPFLFPVTLFFFIYSSIICLYRCVKIVGTIIRFIQLYRVLLFLLFSENYD